MKGQAAEADLTFAVECVSKLLRELDTAAFISGQWRHLNEILARGPHEPHGPMGPIGPMGTWAPFAPWAHLCQGPCRDRGPHGAVGPWLHVAHEGWDLWREPIFSFE